jgi:hypothetical protein
MRAERLSYDEARRIAAHDRAGAFPDPDPAVERVIARARQAELRGDAWATRGDPRRRRRVIIGIAIGAGYVIVAATALILFTIPW